LRTSYIADLLIITHVAHKFEISLLPTTGSCFVSFLQFDLLTTGMSGYTTWLALAVLSTPGTVLRI